MNHSKSIFSKKKDAKSPFLKAVNTEALKVVPTLLRQALKLGDAVNKRELHRTRRPVTLFANDDFGHADFVAVFFREVLVAVNMPDGMPIYLKLDEPPP